MTVADPAAPSLLLVEDDESQAVLFRRVVDRSLGADVTITHCVTAEEAWDRLRAEEDRFLEGPRAVVLDLRLPGADGFDLLRLIRADGRFARLPVVVFSSSASEDEVGQAFSERANSYVVKPTDFGEYARLAEQIGAYWGRSNRVAEVA